MFPNDDTSVEKLELFNINENSTVIHNPIIKINFVNYYIYNVYGSIKYGEKDDEWAAVLLETVNLDGVAFTYTQFKFPSSKAESEYARLFNVSIGSGDSGFRSLKITDFHLITVNRDLNMNKIRELRHKNIISYSSSNVIAKRGITAFINTEYLTDCGSYTFCRLMKKLEVPGDLNFTGLVLSKDTKLEAAVSNFKLNDDTYFTNVTLLLNVWTKENYTYLKFKGNMQIATDPNTRVNFYTLGRFGNNSDSLISLTGQKFGSYPNVFGSPVVTFIENTVEAYLAANASFINPITGDGKL